MYNVSLLPHLQIHLVTLPSAVSFRQVSGTRRTVLEIVQQPQPERS